MKHSRIEIPVIIQNEPGNTRKGKLSFLKDGPVIEIAKGEYLNESLGYSNTKFSILATSENNILPITSKDWVELKPSLVMVGYYSVKPKRINEMYPRSSNNWISHIANDGVEVIIIAQKIENQKKILLSFTDTSTREIYRIEKVNSYEVNLLSQIGDFTFHNRIVERDAEGDRKFISSILDGPAPTWNQEG